MEKYSVLMSVYHKENADYFRLAIDSMIHQTVPPDEFVLICDGPLTRELDDVVADCCEKYPKLMNVIHLEKNMGLGSALNIGLQNCNNELVARMDSDDIAVENRMQMQLEEMKRCMNISVLGGQIAEFYDDPQVITSYRVVPTEESEIRKFVLRRNPMSHVTVVMRKSHVLAVGGYPQFQSPGFEDYYLWVKMLANGYVLRNIGSVCCRVRANASQYLRRGGVKYFMNALRVEKLLLSEKFMSLPAFFVNSFVWMVGTIILPPCFRKSVFHRFLRKGSLCESMRPMDNI